jgi:hypothetical protein
VAGADIVVKQLFWVIDSVDDVLLNEMTDRFGLMDKVQIKPRPSGAHGGEQISHIHTKRVAEDVYLKELIELARTYSKCKGEQKIWLDRLFVAP